MYMCICMYRYVYMCVYICICIMHVYAYAVCGGTHMHYGTCVEGREHLSGISPLPPPCRFQNWAQVVILAGLFSLSQLSGSRHNFLRPLNTFICISSKAHKKKKTSTMTKLRKTSLIKHNCLRHELYFSFYWWAWHHASKRRRFCCCWSYCCSPFGPASHLGPQAEIHCYICSLVSVLPSVLHGLGALKSAGQ